MAAIRAGQLVWEADSFLVDRLQSADVRPNVPKEQIMELGNEYTVGVIRDTPDLSFDCETLDATTKFEALILGGGIGAYAGAPSYFEAYDPTTLFGSLTGQQLDFNAQVPLNILAPFRSSQINDVIVNGCVIPNLALSQMQYRFAVKQNAQMTATFRGDSIFYTPHVPYEDYYIWNGTSTSFVLSSSRVADLYVNPALPSTGSANQQHILNLNYYNPDGSYGRLFNGPTFDYTDTATGFSFNSDNVVLSGTSGSYLATFTSGAVIQQNAIITVQYSSATGTETISNTANVDDGASVKPAAVRAYEINAYISLSSATPSWVRVGGVQSFDGTWTASGMDQNWEFGNALATSIDYVTPAFNGTLTVRANGVTSLINLLNMTSNVSSGQVIGALSSAPVALAITLASPGPAPSAGTVLKTLYTPDAHFEPPDLSSRVQQKIDTALPFQSDTGTFYTFNGLMSGLPAGG